MRLINDFTIFLLPKYDDYQISHATDSMHSRKFREVRYKLVGSCTFNIKILAAYSNVPVIY